MANFKFRPGLCLFYLSKPWLEPQARVPGLSRAGTPSADQAAQALKVRYASETGRDVCFQPRGAMAFRQAPLSDGHSFRLFNVSDDFNRVGKGIEFNLSLHLARMNIRSLN